MEVGYITRYWRFWSYSIYFSIFNLTVYIMEEVFWNRLSSDPMPVSGILACSTTINIKWTIFIKGTLWPLICYKRGIFFSFPFVFLQYRMKGSDLLFLLKLNHPLIFMLCIGFLAPSVTLLWSSAPLIIPPPLTYLVKSCSRYRQKHFSSPLKFHLNTEGFCFMTIAEHDWFRRHL